MNATSGAEINGVVATCQKEDADKIYLSDIDPLTWMLAASASLGTFLVKRLCSLHFKLFYFCDIFLQYFG